MAFQENLHSSDFSSIWNFHPKLYLHFLIAENDLSISTFASDWKLNTENYYLDSR